MSSCSSHNVLVSPLSGVSDHYWYVVFIVGLLTELTTCTLHMQYIKAIGVLQMKVWIQIDFAAVELLPSPAKFAYSKLHNYVTANLLTELSVS